MRDEWASFCEHMRTDFLTDDGFREEETAKGRETMLARPLTNEYTSGREITD